MARLKFATREQLQVINSLGGNRNANRILKEVELDKLIRSFRREQKIYCLTKKGRDMINCDTIPIRREGYVQHTLMANDIFIYKGMPNDWRVEEPTAFKTVRGKVKFVPDAVYSESDRTNFIEVDRHQRMNENRNKIKIYSELQSVFRLQKIRPPSLTFYTMTQVRKRRLKKICDEFKVEAEILEVEDIR
ncbi:replication-relaxation family protein [Radiobacillus sp. PE A8.2]|uniref:replication-relaxation family protein n=1 Tax=Radiobacillus sp. PE A8.2 TaxID=3380349 RepID=UPI00388E75A3